MSDVTGKSAFLNNSDSLILKAIQWSTLSKSPGKDVDFAPLDNAAANAVDDAMYKYP